VGQLTDELENKVLGVHVHLDGDQRKWWPPRDQSRCKG
jgi:hypothetical protein